MPDVLVRGVPGNVLEGLKGRAKRHGRSLQQELKLVLEEVSEKAAPDLAERGREVQARSARDAPIQSGSSELVRENRPREMVSSLGIDMIEIDRVRQALQRWPRLAARLFTEAERAYCDRRADSVPHYAARFAAKEATAKAFGRGLRWHEVEVLNDRSGRPRIALSGEAAALGQGGRLAVSLSHSRDYAVACVLLVPTQDIASHDRNLPSQGVWT